MKALIVISCLLLVACGKKEETQPATTAKAVTEKGVQPLVPEGKLSRMDPDKAKFIAAPSTPKDPEPKNEAKSAAEVKKAETPAETAKK